jgi:hypothetical protein
MFKGLFKLSRKLFVLAALSVSLVFVLSMNPASVKALTPKCCWECFPPGCQQACILFPSGLLCAACLANAEECNETCNPDPLCAH